MEVGLSELDNVNTPLQKLKLDRSALVEWKGRSRIGQRDIGRLPHSQRMPHLTPWGVQKLELSLNNPPVDQLLIQASFKEDVTLAEATHFSWGKSQETQQPVLPGLGRINCQSFRQTWETYHSIYYTPSHHSLCPNIIFQKCTPLLQQVLFYLALIFLL